MGEKNPKSILKLGEEDIHKLLHKKYSKNISEYHDSNLTFGQKLADKVAEVAGSWGFIIGFIIALLLWILLNSVFSTAKSFDPFPFILLNLILSCIAALQSPVIMMSQNRQEAKDRMRSENDYEVNIKSEVIVEDIHIKMDKLLQNQEKLIKDNESLQEEIRKLKETH